MRGWGLYLSLGLSRYSITAGRGGELAMPFILFFKLFLNPLRYL